MLICAAIRRCVRFASRSKKGQSTKFCELVFPLINAIVARQLGMVTLLLEHGASCEVSDSRGTPLAMASKDGWLKGVEVLISHCPDWASPTRRDADTGSTARGLPLNAAAAEGHVDVLRFLLRHGGDPNEKCGEGLTPLVRAAMYGQQQALQLLVIYGANPKAEKMSGMTAGGTYRNDHDPYVLASRNGHDRLVAWLAAVNSVPLVVIALRCGLTDDLKFLVRSGKIHLDPYGQLERWKEPLSTLGTHTPNHRCSPVPGQIQTALAHAAADCTSSKSLKDASELAALLQMWWSIERHPLHPPNVRHALRTVLLLSQRRRDAIAADAGGARDTAVLPPEMWMRVFSFLHRNQWRGTQTPKQIFATQVSYELTDDSESDDEYLYSDEDAYYAHDRGYDYGYGPGYGPDGYDDDFW